MNDFLKYLTSQIVDKPESVIVTENPGEMGITNLELSVDPSDMGRIIGKSGRIIRAVRDLVRILAVKRNVKVNVLLQEQ